MSLNKTMSNAIVMLCMLKDHYVLGACIAAYTHKYLLKKANIACDLVIMCDEFVFDKHHLLLKQYFDKVLKIDLMHFDISKKYATSESWNNKYSWIGYSINKWQCLKLIEYKKILFLDIDILPIKKEFYDVFSYNTPAFHYMTYYNRPKFYSDTTFVSNEVVTDILKDYTSFADYVFSKNVHTLEGGILLLEPCIETYQKYIEFVNKEYTDGMYSGGNTSADETTLFYFYNKIMPEKRFYRISDNNVVIPWDFPKKYIDTATGYNFLSYIKPWLKPSFLSWPEETLWREIYNKMPTNQLLVEVFKDAILKGFRDYIGTSNKERVFNTKIIRNYKKIDTIAIYDDIMKLEEVYKQKKSFGYLKLKDIASLV